jgi:PAS domain S-box-containing protein
MPSDPQGISGAAESSRLPRDFRAAGAGLALLLVAVITGVGYRSIVAFEERAERVDHTHQVQLEVAGLQAMYSRMRFEWRSYLGSGREDSLAGFERVAAGLPGQIERLKGLTADNPRQQERIGRVAELIEADVPAMADALLRRRTGGLSRPEEVQAEFAKGRGTVEGIAAIAAELQQEERRLLAARELEADAAARLAKGVIAAGGLCSLLLLALTLRLLGAEVKQRREAEAAARAAAAEADDLFENAPCGYHSVDDEGRILRINRTWLSWLGYERHEVVGRLMHPELMTPESAAQFREKWFPLFLRQGWLKEVEFEYRRKDGSTFPGSLQTTAVRDSRNRIIASRTVVFDITASKLAEGRIRALNAELQRNAAMLEASNRELESFSYSVSHDLRAPLRAVDGYARMLEEDYAGTLDGEGRRLLAVVRAEAVRMGQLIDDLLSFSRTGRQALQVARVDMPALVKEVVATVAPAYPGARIEVGPLPQATGDRALLRQVWLNLVGNALKYSAKRTAPEVDIGGRAGAEAVEYWVRDNGAGFDPRYAGKLFGVFQRLHGAAEFPGTGVGLAIVQRVVVRHGGRVWADGSPDKGATFGFALPATGGGR